MEAKALTVHTRFFDGYSISYPGHSCSREPMIYPSPTTLIGALAAARARRLKAPEILRSGRVVQSYAASLLDKVKWAAPAILGRAIPYRAMFKALTIPYMRRENRRIELAFTATTVGRVSYDGEAILLYILDAEDAEELAWDAWGITSVGSKESMVEVLGVKVSDVRVVKNSTVRRLATPFPIQYKCLSEKPMGGCEAEYIPPRPEAYTSRRRISLENWYVPCSDGAYGGYLEIGIEDLTPECTVTEFDSPIGRLYAMMSYEALG